MIYSELVAAVEAAAEPGDVPVLYRAIGHHNGAEIRIDGTEPDGWLLTASYLNEINGIGLALHVCYDSATGSDRWHHIIDLPQDPIYDEAI